jgi:DNA-binding XRE family transcriptional regulator
MSGWIDNAEVAEAAPVANSRKDVVGEAQRRELLGDRIRELRKQKGLTIRDLAKELGLTEAAVSRYENGHATPTLDNAVSIAKVLDTNVNDLLEGIY